MEHSFLEMLQDLGGGAAVDEYQARLKEVVNSVKTLHEDGKLTITLKVHLQDDGTVVITDDIKLAKPRRVNSSVYLVEPGGALKVQQLELPVAEVG